MAMPIDLSTRYGVAKPAATHRRPAVCSEVSCKYQRNGWQMRVEEATPIGQRQAHLIKVSGRRFIRIQHPNQVAVYKFEAGQECFGSHTVPVDRPALYLVRHGRAPVKHHVTPDNWVEDFSTHLDKIREQ